MEGARFRWAIVALVVLVVAAGLVWWYMVRGPRGRVSPVAQPPAGGEIAAPDLGADLYGKAANPLGEKLPETVAPVPNPISDIYKNPF